MARTQKNFSVLGDSISTFQGYSPWGAAHYSPDLGAATGVHTVEDTWWMQVIRALQGRLLSNLSRLRQTYPHAQISCGTLILGAVPGTQGSLSCLVQRLAPYNQAIRSAVAQADCQLVDLAAMHSRYDALDAFHPNGTGMAQLARLWLQGMEASSQDRNFF